jgi:hypothetical protein
MRWPYHAPSISRKPRDELPRSSKPRIPARERCSLAAGWFGIVRRASLEMFIGLIGLMIINNSRFSLSDQKRHSRSLKKPTFISLDDLIADSVPVSVDCISMWLLKACSPYHLGDTTGQEPQTPTCRRVWPICLVLTAYKGFTMLHGYTTNATSHSFTASTSRAVLLKEAAAERFLQLQASYSML